MKWLGIVSGVALVAAGCATAPDAGPRLPFHVAVAPVVVPASAPLTEGEEVEGLQLSFESDPMTRALVARLERTFSRVSLLDPSERSVQALVDGSRELGADLILEASLSHESAVDSGLNDRFWLNLVLHAVGGPFSWLVPDRTYNYQAQLEAQMFDVTSAAAASTAANLEATGASVLRVDRLASEVSLNFLERADSALSWILGLVIPVGLLSSESDAVVPELRNEIAGQLAEAIAQAVRERAHDLERSNVVAFYPRGVRLERDSSGGVLIGEMVVEIGRVDELGALRYRFGTGGWREAAWVGEVLEPPAGLEPGRRRYAFRIVVDDSAAETMQLEVEQVDRSLSRRTYTYAIGGNTADQR